jgi:hypothetical protein
MKAGRLISVAFIVGNFVALTGCGGSPDSGTPAPDAGATTNSGSAGSTESGTSATTDTGTAPQAKPVEMTAGEFIAAGKADLKGFNDKYTGAKFSITGKVSDVSEGAIYLTDGASNRLEFWKGRGTGNPWSYLLPGDEVTLLADYVFFEQRGRNELMNVTLVKAAENPRTEVTAQKLAEACLADERAAKEQYKSWMIVTGEIVDLKDSQANEKVFTLKGAESLPVKAWVGGYFYGNTYEPGQTIKFACSGFTHITSSDDMPAYLVLSRAYLADPAKPK